MDPHALELRLLRQEELPQIWTIDRREVIDGIYAMEQGELVLRPEHHDVPGWHPRDVEHSTAELAACWARGGEFWAAFDGPRLVGIAVLDTRFFGPEQDTLQLSFLHVSRDYRDRGLGRRLFLHAASQAQRRGARRLYISATPSTHTVHFYRNLGCIVTPEPDPVLFALEPEDIHFLYSLAPEGQALDPAPGAAQE